ncbi:MAG: hypothetical protein KGD60_09515 [Candidatus Thorarchaeota archaeon]|nr:hypothetical protein [Candidatus Thorarchaeota archaeon]
MARSRGRPVRPMPVHPERVISRAVKAGLSATIELQRNISNKTTVKHYESSQDIWSIRQQVYQLTKEQGTPDYSHILKAEPQIRDNMHKILYEKGAKYGFTEVNRQKKSDDTVGPINQRLNANGAVLREFSQTMFPMPDSVSFGTRTRRDGIVRKKYRVAGYEGSSFGPRTILAHPDLPSMDFGDAVRSHNEYLAAFCAIHDVSVRETTRYSNLFLLLVRPYLEYIYSEYKVGRSTFQKGVNLALRQVKKLILNAGYQPTMYTEKTVTGELETKPQEQKKENKIFFKKQEDEARLFYGDHPAVAELERLRSKEIIGEIESSRKPETKVSEDSLFKDRDVEHIRQKATKRSRVAGSILHRRIADLFPSSWNLNDVIFGGDKYARNSDYIIISEIPLWTAYGAGKIDLILLERTITDDGKRAFWKPVFVLEIKTRKGHSWYVEPDYKISEVRREPHLQRIVGKFPMSDYPLDDDMWNSIVGSTPNFSAQKQLETYAQGLTVAYQEATHQELGHLLQGTIVIDSVSEISTVRRLVERLVIHSYETVKHRTRKIKRTIIAPAKTEYVRIALVVHEQRAPAMQKEEVPKVPWSPIYNPIKLNHETKRHFIVYLAGSSPTSAGQSASWNARNYHGLQMLCELKKTKGNAGVIWIDLASQFNEPHLAEARLRLRPRGYSKEEQPKAHSDHIREFFEKIKVRGHLDDVQSFLFEDGELPPFDLDIKTGKENIIIITGADTLREATPTTHREKLLVLMDHLLSSFPNDEKTTIVWFDLPVPSVEKAVPYSSRAIIPFYETSSLADVATEIIWNLPVAPKGVVQPDKLGLPIIGDAPMHDDIRTIVHHSHDRMVTELTHIPFLRGWSKRFRNKGRGLIISEREFDDVVPEKTLRKRMELLSLTMLPWLVRLFPQETIVEDSAETIEQQFTKLNAEFRGGSEKLTFTRVTLDGIPHKPPSILDLLRFRLPQSMDGQSFQTMTAGKINSQRLYRSPNKLMTRPLCIVPQAPQSEEILVPKDELEQDWIFGVEFKSEEDVTRPWWVVLQDPANEARMLVGCFTNRPAAKGGFLWAETNQETITQYSQDEVFGLPQTIMICKKTDAGLQTWSSMRDGDEVIDSGVLEVLSRGRSTVGHLRAIRQTHPDTNEIRPALGTQPTEYYFKKVVDSLRRYLDSVTLPTPVTVHLEMINSECQVTFHDEAEEENVLQTVSLTQTADLISLLRWPMIKGGPMFTDSGTYVTWSVFENIQFGDLDFLRPYVSYKAARSTPEELPKRIAQFFDEAEIIQVGIEHDQSICPIANGEQPDHGECWRITLPSDCPKQVKRQFGRAMTGEDINGLLAPGRLYAGKLYKYEISLPIVSEKNESVVFHEELYIRMFLRDKGLILKRLTPGTYLSVTRQQWMVDISWEDEAHLKWKAQSTVSELFFKGSHHTIELTHGRSEEKECERILGIITSNISQEQIANYSKLKENLLSDLQDFGYTKTSPPCELRVIESTKSVFSFGVYLVESSSREPLRKITINTTGENSPDSLIQSFESSLSDGELSYHNIRNKDKFMKNLTKWVDKNVFVIDDT